MSTGLRPASRRKPTRLQAALLLAGLLPGIAWADQTAPGRAPSEGMPSEVMPSEVVPSKVVPSKVVPSKVMPSKAIPSKAMPSDAAAGSLRAAETFAMVWEKLREGTFHDDDRDDIDWAALEARHRPAIEGAQDLADLRRELNRLLQAVGVSHLSLIPAEAVPQPRVKPAAKTSADGAVAAHADGDAAADATTDANTDPDPDADTQASAADEDADGHAGLGLRVAMIGGALHILSVDAGSAASAAGLRPGWQVQAIDDWTLDRATASVQAQPDGVARRRALLRLEMGANERLSGLDPDDTVRLRLRDARGRAQNVALTARPTPGPYLELMPGMAPMPFRYSAERLTLPSGACALRVGFDLWAQPAFDRLATTLREQPDCDRLILDLRGNPGGQIFTMTAIGGLLYDKTTSLGTMKTAQGSLRLAVLPRRVADDGTRLRRLGGPVAVLIDRGSASSSEIFTAGLQATGRARVFGETSAGMALPAITARLPSADWLYFPTADMIAPDGRRVEGEGVSPDVAIAPTVATLAAGQDLALAAALEWIDRPDAD